MAEDIDLDSLTWLSDHLCVATWFYWDADQQAYGPPIDALIGCDEYADGDAPDEVLRKAWEAYDERESERRARERQHRWDIWQGMERWS